ncbi:ClpXP protease specificity-enhancing factor SspB [Chelatococcus sp. SYSU_G07232]|uniref:ClpXP protease specificity-enhancing factor SspB n=1 Tax=Chelatococcus albus TaxID=3047466 RepID=A0ABT7AGT1_9HYPH|nr:ClpXP protease specificity-enhancing factor SspB [Chelatococcus sp. SYSU_G07232]MDJ1158582.1 ClpXP protease specificity-enhancing factor SspB [Chelatococcus sp. SYSU_G07232]
MPKDLIRYDLHVQDALKGVVRKVLGDAARDGLPGDHHFYVSFRTEHPGVRMSTRLREKYPQEMTIVLQHQFWDLTVNEHAFEVGLSFSGIPERLLVPFEAISGFFDPSVQFGLKFEVQGEEAEEEAGDEGAPAPDKAAARPRGAATEPAEVAPRAKSRPAATAADAKSGTAPASSDEAAAVQTPEGGDGKGAQVVSLDAFRKKH